MARQELQIKLIPPSKEMRILYGELWQIYLDGPIDSFAPERLEKELIENSVGHSFVHLTSCELLAE